jgi:hypothetical protein
MAKQGTGPASISKVASPWKVYVLVLRAKVADSLKLNLYKYAMV